MQESGISPPKKTTPTISKLRISAMNSITSIKGAFIYNKCNDPVRLLPFYNHRVNISSKEDWRGKILPEYYTYLVQDTLGQDVGFVVVDPDTRLHGRFSIVGYSVKLKAASRKQFYEDLRGVFTHKLNSILGTRGLFFCLKHDPKYSVKLSHELTANGFRMTDSLYTTGPGFNKDSNRLTLTVYVQDRIRTIRQFLYSLSKNSFYAGHEVILICHPGFSKPSLPGFEDGDGPIPMEDWIREYQGAFPRIRIRVMSGYRPDQVGKKPWLGIFDGFNRAIKDILSTEMVVTNMSCGVWWMPNWDLNLLKWRGFADILIPRYVELRARDKGDKHPIWHNEGYCDFIRIHPGDHREETLTDLIRTFGVYPGCAVIEDCAERNYGYVMGMTFTKEAFLHTGDFRPTAYPETSDLFFDDVCRTLGFSKLVSYDSVILRTRYATQTFRSCPTLHGGNDGVWFYPQRKALLFGNTSGCEVDKEVLAQGRNICTRRDLLTADQSVRLGIHFSEGVPCI